MSNFDFHTLRDIHRNLTGVPVVVRVDVNVPIEDGTIQSHYRIEKMMATIRELAGRGAKLVLVAHHSDAEQTLEPVARALDAKVPTSFVSDYRDGAARGSIENMANGESLLFENLRFHAGEKANSVEFAKELASYGDIFINDAFPVAHREHASVVTLPKLLPAFAGEQFAREVKNLSAAFDPARPFTFVLGGAKFSTKLPLVEKFSGVADDVFVGGALANAYLQAAGHPVGSSRLPEESYDLSAGLASEALHLPADVVVESESGGATQKLVADVAADEMVVDIGEQAVLEMVEKIQAAEMVVWNGPLGWYEKGYSEATDRLARAVSESSAHSILGGGDTAAVVLDDMSEEDFGFVSTAGGAMINFLSEEILPGIRALEN